jgi:hypothetical protein
VDSRSQVVAVANRPRFGYYSQLLTIVYSCLLTPTDVLVSTRLPAFSVFSACYCLDRHYVLHSLPLYVRNKIVAVRHTDSYVAAFRLLLASS